MRAALLCALAAAGVKGSQGASGIAILEVGQGSGLVDGIISNTGVQGWNATTRVGDESVLPLALYYDERNEQGCSAVSDAPESAFAAVFDRGGCSFTEKYLAAKDAGASVMIVLDTVEALYGTDDNETFFLKDPCGIDCEISRGNEEAACAASCPSSACAQYQQGKGEFCCLLNRPPTMAINVSEAVSNVTVGEIPAIMISFAGPSTKLLREPGSTAKFFGKPEFRVDGSVVVLILLGTSVVAFASYRGARAERVKAAHLWDGARVRSAGDATEGTESGDARPVSGDKDAEIEKMELSLNGVLVFVLVASAFLVGIFYLAKKFPQQTVLVIIVLFGISAGSAMSHFFLRPLVGKAAPSTCSKPVVVAKKYYLGPLDSVIATVLSFTIVIVWIVFRNSSWAFFLLDILAAAVCCIFLVSIRLPNLKLSCVMLGLFFVYDIFMVFISPLVFGSSVMVDVATAGAGGSSPVGKLGAAVCERTQSERMPMLFMIPRFNDPTSFSMLGLGDIFVPGLLITYAARFDYLKAMQRGELAKSAFRVHHYYWPLVAAYFVGLSLAFTANLLELNFSTTVKGQPALLYLVPCTLLTFIALAYFRGDLGDLWNLSYEQIAFKRLGAGASRAAVPATNDQSSLSTSSDP